MALFKTWRHPVGQLLLVAAVFGVTMPAPAADTGPRLNVVFILADDLGWGEVGCFGQQKIPTPNLDRLAAQGMRLTQHYSGAPVCAPSRCVLMTGMHLGHAEIRSNLPAKARFPEFPEGQYPLSAQARTVAQVFQKAGYATAAMGKWGLGPVGSTGSPDLKGFDLFFGYNCQSVAHSYYPHHLWHNREQVVINASPIPGHAKQPEGPVRLTDWTGPVYAPRLMIEVAERFIDEHQQQPFLLYLPFIEPHVALHPPAESVNRFPAEWDDDVYRGQCGYLPHPRPRAAYAAMISDLDGYVGRVLDRLEAAGLTDRTLVIFSSDNGTTHPVRPEERLHIGGVDAEFFQSTAGLRGYKGSVYEGGLRVPTIVRLPGVVPANTACDSPGYFADWFPTLCDAAGLSAPEGLDGESLWPVLTSGTPRARAKPMLWVFPGYRGQIAVRLGNYKLIRQNLLTKTPGAWEVYDLANDRSEQHNIAGQQAPLIAEAETLLQQEVQPNDIFPLMIPPVVSVTGSRAQD